ncbi:energy transducer TonB [Nitrospirillum viridazoti]|uniref:TonB family protein n=1 Tax=Nitrospirillum amazonense TaxID=28077 RepID=A0A560HQS6_9PROT|nr:energy transducer TonB [Nitrospirillum amazonense]TWB47594.1 TonB family protein [Nitrospirillum amazonense]
MRTPAIGLLLALTLPAGIGRTMSPPIDTCIVALPETVPLKTAPKFRNASFKAPDYPLESRIGGEMGRVTLGLLCRADGHIIEAQVLGSSNYPRLDQSALSMAKADIWRCIPGIGAETGQPVTAWLQATYWFVLSNDERTLPGGVKVRRPIQTVPASSCPNELPPPLWEPPDPEPLSRQARIFVPSFTPPSYPAASLKRREEGAVTFAIQCGSDGHMRGSKIIHSSGYPRLDHALLVHLRKNSWRCDPGISAKTGQPVATWAKARYRFTLPEDATPSPAKTP